MNQHIILCLKDSDPHNPKDSATYVQSTRRRMSFKEAVERAEGYAPSRHAVVLAVPSVPIDEDGYPTGK